MLPEDSGIFFFHSSVPPESAWRYRAVFFGPMCHDVPEMSREAFIAATLPTVLKNIEKQSLFCNKVH
jgi:hypothetical protein